MPLSVPLPASPLGPQKVPPLGSASPGVEIDSAGAAWPGSLRSESAPGRTGQQPVPLAFPWLFGLRLPCTLWEPKST